MEGDECSFREENDLGIFGPGLPEVRGETGGGVPILGGAVGAADISRWCL